MSRRALTEGEIELARAVFGERIDFGPVGIRHGHGGNPFAWLAFKNPRVDAITLIRTIFFKSDPGADFSKGGDATLFLHEMTHIWQYQALGVARFYWRYLIELEAVNFKSEELYRYGEGTTPFGEAWLEAQAQMVQNYEVARRATDSARVAAIARNLTGSGFHGF
jgi:hypothetical protein